MNLDFSSPPPSNTCFSLFWGRRPTSLFPPGSAHIGTVWGSEFCGCGFWWLPDGAIAETCRVRRPRLLWLSLPRGTAPTWETAGEKRLTKGVGRGQAGGLSPGAGKTQSRKGWGQGWGTPSIVTVCGSQDETLISLQTWMRVMFDIMGTLSMLSVKAV